MKTSEAPKKIYVSIHSGIHHYEQKNDDDIEYIRTDAFIEKADEFIGSFFHPDDTELRNCLLKKFHEYMGGE